MVPDVSGIDKIFDYLVPDSLAGRIGVGDRVRVDLNGRRVGGWVTSLEQVDGVTRDGLSVDRLSPVVSLSGLGVEPGLVGLTRWAAHDFFGSWRSMLSRASAPRVRARAVNTRRTSPAAPVGDPVADAAIDRAATGGGLLVVPPCASALAAVAAVASRGPVLVVCPTQRMAVMGAAALRRRGMSTATVPEEWDSARAGVDVVIGARSAVFAPCPGVATIVVIDEHDELHHDERAPTWNSVDVALERARQEDAACILTSSVPSAGSLVRHADSTTAVQVPTPWPRVVVQDLNDVPVARSLLSSSMLDAVTRDGATTVCVLNTKGKARIVVCRSCNELQTCTECGSSLGLDDEQVLHCVRCAVDRGSVCVACGRASFTVPRGGTGHLAGQLRKSTGRTVVEVTGDGDDTWTTGNVFVGTEAVLYRIPQADTVVFADIDRDLNAPRITSGREVLSLIARAARLVGAAGTVVLQSRVPEHPVLRALAAPDPTAAVLEWAAADIATRRGFSFPPFGVLAELSLAEGAEFGVLPDLPGVRCAVSSEGILVAGATRDDVRDAIAVFRGIHGNALRVHADPPRY